MPFSCRAVSAGRAADCSRRVASVRTSVTSTITTEIGSSTQSRMRGSSTSGYSTLSPLNSSIPISPVSVSVAVSVGEWVVFSRLRTVTHSLTPHNKMGERKRNQKRRGRLFLTD